VTLGTSNASGSKPEKTIFSSRKAAKCVFTRFILLIDRTVGCTWSSYSAVSCFFNHYDKKAFRRLKIVAEVFNKAPNRYGFFGTIQRMSVGRSAWLK
jgi:hypothetical protein